MRVEVKTTHYEFAHGRKPRGTGLWMFHGYNDRSGRTFEFNGTYSEAKKEAVKWARSRDCHMVEVCS